MEISEEDYIAHYGKKGMKWGERTGVRTKAPRGDFKSRNKKQKAVLIAGGIAGWVASGKLMDRVLKDKAPWTQLAVGAASTVAGARMTRQLIDLHGNRAISELPSHK